MYLQRADSLAGDGAYAEAFADYVTAADQIEPRGLESQDAINDQLTAVFGAAEMALRVGDEEVAGQWYAVGIRLAQGYEQESAITRTIDRLTELATAEPSLADRIEPILGELEAALPNEED